MLNRRTIASGLAATLVAATPALATRAATPSQAFTQVKKCLLVHGALKVEHTDRDGGGRVYFDRPFNFFGSWLSWSFVVEHPGDRVAGVMTAYGKLTAADRRAANRCLAPFGGA